jgi:tetratricopeptide (TPR) repeat protein
MPTPQHSHAGHALGQVDFPVSCSPAAQSGFDEAMALLHHMTYPQAREAFGRVAAIHPACAMAHWGIAMTLFQPLWPTRPGPTELRRGREAVAAAQALAPQDARERAFIAFAAAFFADPAGDYWTRIRRWEAATATTFDAFPEDPDAAAFRALALLATAPADRVDRGPADRAAALLGAVLATHPDHPGAMHYLVHANDMPGREHESLDVTREYDRTAPRNPHALHMPTHIYTRLGDWEAAARGNERAAEAALDFPAGDQGQYVWDEFAHAIEYLVYARLQQGDDEAARGQWRRLQSTAQLEPSFKTAFHLASTPARLALERHDWAAAAELAPREPATIDWDRFPWPEATARFARGLGLARLGHRDETRAEIARLGALEARMRDAGETLFERSIRVMRLELEAWVAQQSGDGAVAAATLRAAAALEADTPKHAVTPGPTLPAHEQLGDLLMLQRQPRAALEAYRESLQRQPNRFNSLLGAARAATAAGERSAASASYRQLLAVAAARSQRPGIAEAWRVVGAAGQRETAVRGRAAQ